MANFHYPYTDFHELNLDWVIMKVKELAEQWAQTSQAWSDTQAAWEDMKDYINNYFDNLDVQQEINVKLADMAESGELSTLISPFVASGLPDVVSVHLTDVVSLQIGGVVAEQIPFVVQAQLPAVVAAYAAGQVAAWLSEHVDPETGYVIDDTLTIQGAAADAKATGDAIEELKSALISTNANVNNISDLVGGIYYIYPNNRVSTMKNGSGEDRTETSNLHFHKVYVKGATSVAFTLETVTSDYNAHWVNELDENGNVLNYESVVFSTGSNKTYTRTINASCAYVVISVWINNGNFSATADYGTKITQTISTLDGRVTILESVQEYQGDNVDVNIKNIEILENEIGGKYALNGFSRVNTMVGTDGTTKTESSSLHFYECSNIKGSTTLDFVFSNTTSETVIHWFNQYDNNNNLLSYVPISAIVGENKHNVVNLESGCVKVVISIWINTNLKWYCMHNVNNLSKFAKISGLGDSITAGYSQYETVTNTYQKLIANTLGASYQNLGISSTPVCPNSDYTGGQNDNAFVYRYTSISNDTDMIIIAGGTNDFRHNVPLGTESDTDALYEQTFYGACDYLLKNITATYPNAKVVWISPFHQIWDVGGNTSGIQLSAYIDAIKDKCRKYGVTFIDAFACSGMSMSVSCISNFMPDSIHPNTAGHLLIYKNLMPYFAML